jgi:RNA polymerase sigma factor (sigma-70 family)
MFVSTSAKGGLGGATEVTLVQQAQAGCPDSLNALMARHEGLIQAVVRQQVLGALPFAEALQAGRIGLWQAILGYDAQRGPAFSTYAWVSIMHHVWRAVKAHTRRDPPTLLRAGFSSPPITDPVTLWEQTAVQQALTALVQRLPERLKQVVVERYGLNGTPPTSFRQIGARLGLSGERARQLHTEALVWLRHPAHSHHLRSLLGRHTLADYEAAVEQAHTWLRRRRGRHGG